MNDHPVRQSRKKVTKTQSRNVKLKMGTWVFKYLGGDNVISHIPKTRVHVRCVGKDKTFHFGGDRTDDRVRVLVGLLGYTHVSTGGLQHSYTVHCLNFGSAFYHIPTQCSKQ